MLKCASQFRIESVQYQANNHTVLCKYSVYKASQEMFVSVLNCKWVVLDMDQLKFGNICQYTLSQIFPRHCCKRGITPDDFQDNRRQIKNK